MLTYKAVGASDRLSDGEEGYLPVLSRRMLVMESLPLPIRGHQTREFDFERLRAAAASDTLRHQSLTVQVTSNPAWYAVMALPYLMEFPHECSEQIFNRLYANHARGDTSCKVIRAFGGSSISGEAPRHSKARCSKNEDLKSIMIQETPWLLEAKDESQARRDVAILFEQNRVRDEQIRCAAQAHRDAICRRNVAVVSRWPVQRVHDALHRDRFRSASSSGRGGGCYVSPPRPWRNSTSGSTKPTIASWSVSHLDQNNLSPTICLYLYGRSFFLKDQAIGEQARAAVDYFLGQAREHWVSLGDRLPQGHLAIALKRFGDLRTPQAIVKSLSERTLRDDEMGMFWRRGRGRVVVVSSAHRIAGPDDRSLR